MSREIKFRVWDKTSEEMLYQDDFERVEIDTKNKMVTLIADEESDKSHYVLDYEDGIEAEIMQYTGFNDTKDKEIYEGDILKFTQIIKKIFHPEEELEIIEFYTDIKWEEGCYWIKDYRDDEYRDMLGAFIGDVYPLTEIEVVGDIYNNPELLEGEEQCQYSVKIVEGLN